MTDPTIDPDLVEHLDDDTLLRAYQRAVCDPREPNADVLFAEIERRVLDV